MNAADLVVAPPRNTPHFKEQVMVVLYLRLLRVVAR